MAGLSSNLGGVLTMINAMKCFRYRYNKGALTVKTFSKAKLKSQRMSNLDLSPFLSDLRSFPQVIHDKL